MRDKNFEKTICALLLSVQQDIKTFINAAACSYETFGKIVENSAVESLVKQLYTKNIIVEHRTAAHKNEFPDLRVKLTCGRWVAIDVKASNHSGYKKGEWKPVKKPANDLATFKTLPSKLDEWGEDNIYFLWVHYDFTDKKQVVLPCEFAPFYTFVGKNKKGLIEYRISDGKLRPRGFDQAPRFNTFEEFEVAFRQTSLARKERIILREFEELSLKQRRIVLKKLEAAA